MRHEDVWDTAERYDTPGTGMFAPDVLEPAVHRLRELAGGGPAREFAIGTGRVAIPPNQHIVSHHFRFDDSKNARPFRGPHRYIWPAELDLMVRLAGLERETRHADRRGTPFTAESPSRVSRYRKPDTG